jgi:cation diffusion facilitator CzcD-associated flavoprotein CzcO
MNRCAIVGGGIGGFVAYATLRHGGLEPGEITVFDPDPDPLGTWLGRAAAIRQRRMRSESEGHCYPRSFPGLAPREAYRTGSLSPLAATVCNRYRPTIDEFVRHVEELRARTSWDDSVVPRRVERLQAEDDRLGLDGLGWFRHVLLATGHPGLAVPEELRGDPRVVHAYEPHDYGDTVAVVGAGMAAATEWLNALAAGAEVVSVRRREPVRRPLNLPRPLFSKRGLARIHGLPRAERAALLTALLEPSYPPGREWDQPLEEAAADGRFRIAASIDGADQIVCATGFRRGFRHDPLLRRLVEEHGLETEGRWLVLGPDATVPRLTGAATTLAVAGVAGQWAYPAADTLMGMKYVARRFLNRVKACRTR